MPALEVPAGFPCPQTSTVSPEERRLLSEDGNGPLDARAIELDERQMQSFSWMLSAEEATVFKAWWRDVLIYGGAWFAAPATWPSLEGQMVKVRRFISSPQWEYQGNGFWKLFIDAEVRGESELPNEAVPSEPREGWNTTAITGSWTFSNSDFTAEVV